MSREWVASRTWSSRTWSSRENAGNYMHVSGEDSDASVSDEDSDGFMEFERDAIAGPSMERLLEKASAGQWPLERRSRVLEEAALKGELVRMLEAIDMPLFMHVRLASSYFQLAGKQFNAMDEESDEENGGSKKLSSRRGDASWLQPPSRFARLLSNYLIVPGVPVYKWLEESEVQMVVFDGKEPVEHGMRDFPEKIGAFYLTPRVEWKGDNMIYEVLEGEGRFTVLHSHSTLHNLAATEPFDFNFPLGKIPHGIAPEATKKFAYVYPHFHFRTGGFLYLGAGLECLAVSQLTANVSSHGVRMGERFREGVDKGQDLKPQPTTLPAIKRKGATHFCFYGPNYFHKDKGMGGFVYWFEDDKSDISYFPIRYFSKVLEHGPAGAVGNAKLLPRKPHSNMVVDGIMTDRWHSESRGLTYQIRHGCVDMKVCKLKQKGLTHPVVLRSLVFTPEECLLESEQVQAIVTAAFHTCSMVIVREMFIIASMMVSIFRFTYSFRNESPDAWGTRRWTSFEWALLGVMVAAWTMTVSRLLFGIVGYRVMFGSFDGYFLYSYRTCVWWLQSFTVICLIVMLLRGTLYYFPRTAAIAFASSGAFCWMELLFLARSFTVIGKRFLPIMSAWSDATSFLFVTSFILAASVQASYSLTRLPLSAIAFDTYRMGFLGELKPRLFVSQAFDLDEHPDAMSSLDMPEGSRTSFGYIVLMIFGFILMVSMANIFIQVMGDAYSSNKQRVQATLTRARAEESLICALWMAGREKLLPPALRTAIRAAPRDELVWFTRRDAGAFGGDSDVDPASPQQAIIAAVAAAVAVAATGTQSGSHSARARAAGQAATQAAGGLGGCAVSGALELAVENAVLEATHSSRASPPLRSAARAAVTACNACRRMSAGLGG